MENDIHIYYIYHLAKSLCYTAEINRTLKIKYTSLSQRFSFLLVAMSFSFIKGHYTVQLSMEPLKENAGNGRQGQGCVVTHQRISLTAGTAETN